MPPQTIAVDWSGAKKGARKKIWLAEVCGGELVRLEDGRNRKQIAEHLVAAVKSDPDLVVGLDFAFSVPEWFIEERGLSSARELWALADERSEEWLRECSPPFWGRRGRTCPELPAHYRQTEIEAPAVGGIRPKSVFQIGGAGAVGTGSLRGMPLLLDLSRAGYSVWPFDEAVLPLVVEIYPRLLTQEVIKSDENARAKYLRRRYPALAPEWREIAASSEDAFDAAVSALVMADHLGEIGELEAAADSSLRLEGAIWYPSNGASEPEHRPSKNPINGYGLLLHALRFAANKHRDQRRKDRGASPYINHPIAVAETLAGIGGITDPVTLQAAVLHDTIEDTETTPEELEERFGTEVRRVVEEMSDDKSLPKLERKRLQIEHAAQISRRAQQVKIADKISNVVDVTHSPPKDWSLERRREYQDWTERVVAECRGCNPALEAHYDKKLREGRSTLENG